MKDLSDNTSGHSAITMDTGSEALAAGSLSIPVHGPQVSENVDDNKMTASKENVN